MPSTDEVLEAFNEKIMEQVAKGGNYAPLLRLAEARARFASPSQSHGSSSAD
jgi:hypothetical protein